MWTDGGAYQGFVQLQQGGPVGQPAAVRVALAGFYVVSGSGGSSSCTTSTIGPCSVTECPADAGTTAGDGGAYASAGSLSFQVNGGSPLALTQGTGSGSYSRTEATPGDWWSGGETVTLTASGSDAGVPPFVVNLMAPRRRDLTQPQAGNIMLTRGTDLVVGWSTQTPSYLQLVTGDIVNGPGAHGTCVPQPGSCGMTIPAAVTQKLVPGNGSLAARYDSNALASPGPWSIRINLTDFSYRVLMVQ